MKFTASYDLTVKAVTVLVALILLSLAFYFAFQILYDLPDAISILTYSFSCSVTIGILLICYLYSPQHYILNEDSFIIKRVVKDRQIMLKDVASVRLIEPAELRGVIRTFGVGGVFGYFGKFASLKLGSMTWYASQRRNMVLITLQSGSKIVVTPDDMHLIDAIQLKIKR